jgi:hypothetical protein
VRLTPGTGSYTHLCKVLKILGVLKGHHFNDFNNLRHLCIKMSARHQARGTSGARHERSLFPVACMPLFGPDSDSDPIFVGETDSDPDFS